MQSKTISRQRNAEKNIFKVKKKGKDKDNDDEDMPRHVDSETIPEKVEKAIGYADTPDDQMLWKSYMVFLAWEAAAEKSPAQQIQCFLWRHQNGKKPAEIADVLGISPLQVSEHIRAFKNKLANAMRDLDETYDPDQTDWEEIKPQADSAKKKYLAIAEAFPIAVEGGHETR